MSEAGRRFVVQRHQVSPDEVHFDLMVEDAGVLVTVQLPEPPADAPLEGRASFDHRLRYLDYEGEISGGRGAVAIWDRGQVVDVSGSLRGPRYRARWAGTRWQGEAGWVRDGEVVRWCPEEGV